MTAQIRATKSELPQFFESEFGQLPTHGVWSPGRVNLIGEHTDYNMLPVLPMAIGRGFNWLVRANGLGKVRVRNLDPSYRAAEFDASGEIPPSPPGHWANYIKAAVQATWPLIRQARGEEAAGFDAVLDSSLPPAAGLSSSSALVVGSHLALTTVNHFAMNPADSAGLMCHAEHYTGTAGGGMDQAVILLGQSHCALEIHFGPLRAEKALLPEDAAFFAVDSLQRAVKSGKTRFEYNRRVFECAAGLELLRRHAVRIDPACQSEQWRHLRDAAVYFKQSGISHTRFSLEAIGTEAWSPRRLRNALGAIYAELLTEKKMPPAGSSPWRAFGGFNIHSRLAHVFGEAERVHKCAQAFASGRLDEAATHISLSHASCRDLYHISTPEIERLAGNAVRCGALAARITGAGFGGSVVAMTTRRRAAEFSGKLWETHFAPMPGNKPASGGIRPESVIIDCEPASGAASWIL
ncbi:MAG: hypothetical protein NTY46_03750 [Candidatus Sumerlaeota bacterium]|nr:hypothetical protein [Candidatus Sumerlaeota bacterium]